MLNAALVPVLLLLAQADGSGPTSEEANFEEARTYSARFMSISAVGPDRNSVKCPEGHVLDWAAFQYHTPTLFHAYGPADQWRCVKPSTYQESLKLPKYSRFRQSGELPFAGETSCFSNLEAATYERFQKSLQNCTDGGFVWQVSDKTIAVFTTRHPKQVNAAQSSDADPPTWDLAFKQITWHSKKDIGSYPERPQFGYAEPKVRLFHDRNGYDLFLITTRSLQGGRKFYLWTMKKEKGAASLDQVEDTMGLDTFKRNEFLLRDGWLWQIRETRLTRGQKERIFDYWRWDKGGFQMWREGMPGPKPPATTMPPAP